MLCDIEYTAECFNKGLEVCNNAVIASCRIASAYEDYGKTFQRNLGHPYKLLSIILYSLC